MPKKPSVFICTENPGLHHLSHCLVERFNRISIRPVRGSACDVRIITAGVPRAISAISFARAIHSLACCCTSEATKTAQRRLGPRQIDWAIRWRRPTWAAHSKRLVQCMPPWPRTSGPTRAAMRSEGCGWAVCSNGATKLEKAEAAYRRADEQGDGYAATALGGLLYERGDMDGAEAAWRRGDLRGNADAALQVGQLLRRQGQLDAAEAAIRRAIERGQPSGVRHLAFLLSQAGYRHEAVEALMMPVGENALGRRNHFVFRRPVVHPS
jgi:tetratricopeptide (TPR) repeat protein